MTTITMAIYAYLGATWTDITSDVLASGVSASWGMDSNSPINRIAKTGQMTFSLKNSTGKYIPGGASVISADWKKGAKVKAVFTYGTQSWTRFLGSIDTIKIDAGTSESRRVHVTVLDWMSHASKYPLRNPAIQLNKRIDEALDTIIDAMPIQPVARDIDTGANTFPMIFNDATLYTKAYSEFSKLVSSELGYIYVKKDQTNGETFRAESQTARGYFGQRKQVIVTSASENLLMEDGNTLLMEDGDTILIESYSLQDVSIDDTMIDMDVTYGENLINRITVSANPTKTDTEDTLIYNLDSAVYISTEATIPFDIQFTEASSKRVVAALPPEDNYPTTLFHFDEPLNGEELIKEESGKPFDDFSSALVTNIKKFGASSLYLDGGGSYIRGNASNDYELGSGDFTIEWWEYRFNANSNTAVVCRDDSGSYPPFAIGVGDGTNSLIYMTSNGSSWDIANGRTFGAAPITTWTHYAICRNGSNFYAFKNGTLTDSWTSSATIRASTSDLYIGKNGSTYLTACLDEMRIIKGSAIYTATFTPPTEPFSLSGLIFAAWTNANGTGTEITGDCTLSITYGGAGATINVTNTGTTPGYLTTLKIFGKVIESVSPITNTQEDTASINAYGYSEANINQVYQQDFANGREEAAKILSYYKYPITTINKITINANRDEAHTQYFLDTDVGDLVRISETQTETISDFYINGMGWDTTAGASGVIVNYWWIVKRFRDASTDMSPLNIRFADLTTNDNRVNFGYIPSISQDNVPYRMWSFWYNSSTARQDAHFVDAFGNSTTGFRGYSIRMTQPGRVDLYLKSGTTAYRWRTGLATTPNVNNTWHHIFVAWDSSTAAAPVVYINGTLEATSLFSSWSTDNTTEVGTELLIGYGFQTGTMRDIRIYNGDMVSSVPALAAALYAETPYGNANVSGLLFRSFKVLNDELADYEGEYLTEQQKVYDDIGFTIGTPEDSPLGVAN